MQAYFSREFCGGKGIRTPGLLIANETLYQLSYTPSKSFPAKFYRSIANKNYRDGAGFSKRKDLLRSGMHHGSLQDNRSSTTLESTILLSRIFNFEIEG